MSFACLLQSVVMWAGAAHDGVTEKYVRYEDLTLKTETNNGQPRTFSRVRAPVIGSYASATELSPVVVGDSLLIFDNGARLTAVRGSDPSEVIWSVALLSEEEQRDVYTLGLVYSKGVVLCVVDNFLYGVDFATGQVKWKKELKGFLSGDLVIVNEGEAVAVQLIDDYLYVFDVDDGSLLWHYGEVTYEARVRGSLSVAYSPAHSLIVMVLPDGKVLCLDSRSGNKMWRITLEHGSLGSLGYTVTSPMIVADEVFVVDGLGRLQSIELSSGKQLWSMDFQANSFFGVGGANIFVLTKNNELLAFDASSKSELWRLELRGLSRRRSFWNGVPVLLNGKLWLLSTKGDLLGIDARSGALEEEYFVRGSFKDSPIVFQGALYISEKTRGLVIVS